MRRDEKWLKVRSPFWRSDEFSRQPVMKWRDVSAAISTGVSQYICAQCVCRGKLKPWSNAPLIVMKYKLHVFSYWTYLIFFFQRIKLFLRNKRGCSSWCFQTLTDMRTSMCCVTDHNMSWVLRTMSTSLCAFISQRCVSGYSVKCQGVIYHSSDEDYNFGDDRSRQGRERWGKWSSRDGLLSHCKWWIDDFHRRV